MPITGTDLGDISTATSAGSGDAAKIVLLNSSGQVDSSMLPAPATGDITSVTAGTGLTGGGTSGAVTLNVAYGTSSSTAAVGNDSRLSDARDPIIHTQTLKASPTSSDEIVIADAAASFTLKRATLSSLVSGSAEVVNIQYFSSVGTLSNAVGAIGDIAIVAAGGGGGSDQLYYKNASNVWVLGGPLSGAGGTLTGITTGATSGLSGGGTSGILTLLVAPHSATLKSTPTSSDELLIADAAASNALKRITVGTLPFTNLAIGTTAATACEGNDARLTDSRNPIIHTQTLKGTPASADEIVIADSAASYALKRATISSLPAAGSATSITESSGPTALSIGAVSNGQFLVRSGSTIVGATSTGFAVLTDINPLHYWRASVTTQSGGLVDQITDAGRTVKHFTQTGTPRCPTATDGLGNTYLAPDGTNDYYASGVSADWTFLNNGSKWSIGFIANLATVLAAESYLLATYDGGGTNGGFVLTATTSGGGGLWSPRPVIFYNGTGVALSHSTKSIPANTMVCCVIRHWGQPVVSGGVFYRAQTQVNNAPHCYTNSDFSGLAGYSTSNPTNASLLLFSNNTTPSSPTAMRLYELWIEDRVVSDRLVSSYGGYAATTFGCAS